MRGPPARSNRADAAKRADGEGGMSGSLGLLRADRARVEGRGEESLKRAETHGDIKRFRAPFVVFEHVRKHTVGMTKTIDHDAYIAAAPEQLRAILGRLRAQLSRALPDAEEVIKYDMPGFQIEETIIAGYAAFSKQCGLYVDPGAISAHADEIASLKLKATKTGVTFSVSKPITDGLIEKLAISSRSKKGF